MKKLTMVITPDSCNGEEQQFLEWMEKNHPEIETYIENSFVGGMVEAVVENYWEQYCSESE